MPASSVLHQAYLRGIYVKGCNKASESQVHIDCGRLTGEVRCKYRREHVVVSYNYTYIHPHPLISTIWYWYCIDVFCSFQKSPKVGQMDDITMSAPLRGLDPSSQEEEKEAATRWGRGATALVAQGHLCFCFAFTVAIFFVKMPDLFSISCKVLQVMIGDDMWRLHTGLSYLLIIGWWDDTTDLSDDTLQDGKPF